MSDMERERDEARRALAASQQDLSHVERQLREAEAELHQAQAEIERLAAAADQGLRRAVQLQEARTEVGQLRIGVAGVLAELRELAGDARAEAAPFRHTSSPLGFGPHRAAEAYEKAAALLQALGGEDRG